MVRLLKNTQVAPRFPPPMAVVQPGPERLTPAANVAGGRTGAPGPATTRISGGSFGVGSVVPSAVMAQRSVEDTVTFPELVPTTRVAPSDPRFDSKETGTVIGDSFGFWNDARTRTAGSEPRNANW